jgi:hypothetical protein
MCDRILQGFKMKLSVTTKRQGRAPKRATASFERLTESCKVLKGIICDRKNDVRIFRVA